jgi:hypothetical protein
MLLRRLFQTVSLVAVFVPFWWYYHQASLIPDPSFFREVDRAKEQATLQSLGLAALELVCLIAMGLLISKVEQRRYEKWRQQHIHEWKGCVCQTKGCGQTRHYLDENCHCKDCNRDFHVGRDTSWNFGSTHVVEETCTQCGQKSGYSYYAG